MTLYSCLRSVVRKSVCVAAFLAATSSFAASPDRQQVQAQVLDRAEFLCDNCLFGASDYYYCFEADNKILVGRLQELPDRRSPRLGRLDRAWRQRADRL